MHTSKELLAFLLLVQQHIVFFVVVVVVVKVGFCSFLKIAPCFDLCTSEA